jgi:hypothetical protein
MEISWKVLSLNFELNHIKLNPNRHIDNTYYYTHEI